MKYPWAQNPMTLEYIVLHSLEAGACQAYTVVSYLRRRGLPFTVVQVRGALQRLRRAGKAEHRGGHWVISEPRV